MKNQSFLLIIVLLLSCLWWCSLTTKNSSSSSEKLSKPYIESNGNTLVSNKNLIKSNKFNIVEANLQKLNKWIEKSLVIWNIKILSWIQNIFSQIKNNQQFFNQQWLQEIKKTMLLYKENLKLMHKLIYLEENFYKCFKWKYIPTIPKSNKNVNKLLIQANLKQPKQLEKSIKKANISKTIQQYYTGNNLKIKQNKNDLKTRKWNVKNFSEDIINNPIK